MENESPRQCVIPLHKPDNRELLFFFVTGVVVSVPMALFFESLYPFVSTVIAVSVLAPFIEELAKVFPLFYRHGETESSIVTLGVLMGLGFGVSEMVEYVVLLNASPIVRLPAVIFHASSAAITAFGIAKKNPLPYYLISVTLHATNNFFALTNLPIGVLVEFLVVIAAYYLAYRFYSRASKEKIVV